MSRADGLALWHEVNRTIIGLTGVVEMFAKRASHPSAGHVQPPVLGVTGGCLEPY